MANAEPPPTIRHLIAEGERALNAAGIGPARLEAEVLLARRLGVPRPRLILEPREAVAEPVASAFREDLAVASDVESAVIARRLVWSALDQLEPRRRAIVVMHELEGMTAAAIAATLGLRRMTVHWHLSMGRKDLRRVLAPHMGETT